MVLGNSRSAISDPYDGDGGLTAQRPTVQSAPDPVQENSNNDTAKLQREPTKSVSSKRSNLEEYIGASLLTAFGPEIIICGDGGTIVCLPLSPYDLPAIIH